MKLEGNLLFFQAPFVMLGVLLRFHQLDIMYEQRLGFFASPGVLAYILFPNTMQFVAEPQTPASMQKFSCISASLPHCMFIGC